MSDTLSINVVPGYLPGDDELITPAILRALARPNITLVGSIGSASLADGSVTTAKLADGVLSADVTGRNKMADKYVTAAKLADTQDWSGKTLSGNPSVTWTGVLDFSGATVSAAPGSLVQQLYASTVLLSTLTTGGVGTGDLSGATSGSIPVDDTIPQSGEGAQLFSLAITPKKTTNILEFEVYIPAALTSLGAGGNMQAALFQDATANALAVAIVNTAQDGFDQGQTIMLRHRMVAGTTSATTFKIRVGVSTNNMTINGSAGSRQFGGINAARFFIKEIAA